MSGLVSKTIPVKNVKQINAVNTISKKPAEKKVIPQHINFNLGIHQNLGKHLNKIG